MIVDLLTTLTDSEWAWISAHPDDPDARLLIRFTPLPRAYWTRGDHLAVNGAVDGLRRTIAKGAA